MRKYKYKRGHFNSQEEYDRFRGNRVRWQQKWLRKSEQHNPERKERRLLRSRLYNRYYLRYYLKGKYRRSFCEWLKELHQVDDLNSVSLSDLRTILDKS